MLPYYYAQFHLSMESVANLMRNCKPIGAIDSAQLNRRDGRFDSFIEDNSKISITPQGGGGKHV
jgi:hypothetical protein